MLTSDAPGAILLGGARAGRDGRAPAPKQATRKPDGWCARGRRYRGDPQGLSAPVRDLHRAGDPRPRAARGRPGALLAAAPDGSRDASDPRGDPGAGRLPAGVPAPRAGARLPPVAPCAPPSRIPRRRRGVVARFPARPDAQPDSPDRAGLRAGGRVAGQRRPPARAFPAYARVGDPLCGAAAGTPLELLRAREGHLDHARVGKARKARRLRVDDDLHRGQRAAPARARAPGPGRGPQLSRDRYATVSAAARRASRARWRRSRRGRSTS